MVFNRIGYRATLAILVTINIIALATIQYTIEIRELYCFMIFVANSCLGGFLVLNITHSHLVFGIEVGGDLDLFYWSFFSFSNFIGYFYVSFLSGSIGFNNIFYICLAMNVTVYPLLALFHGESKWSMAQAGVHNDDTDEIHKDKAVYDATIAEIRASHEEAAIGKKDKDTNGQNGESMMALDNSKNKDQASQEQVADVPIDAPAQ